MEVTNGLLIVMIPLLTVALVTGWVALSFNRKFWPWFVAGLVLPLTGVVIIFCLPVKEKKVPQALLKPVSSEEIFDPVLELKEPMRMNGNEVQFSARA